MKKWWILPVSVVLIDQAIKLWAQKVLRNFEGGVMPAWDGVFRLHYAQNTGAAFSFLHGNNAALIGVTLILILLVTLLLFRLKPLSNCARTGLLMVLGGGVGNLIDRLVYGYVVDFIDLTFMRFAVFNVADVFVCTGAALTAISLLIGERRSKADGMDH